MENSDKQQQDEIKVNIDGLPKKIERYSDDDADSQPVKLHWTFRLVVWFSYLTIKYRNQILFVTSFYSFVVWLHKLYEDVDQAIEYSNDAHGVFFIVSLLMLILPTFMCTIYLTLTKLIEKHFEPAWSDIVLSLLNGLMLVPWQAKQSLDTLHFSAQRVCCLVWHADEKKQVFSMGVDSDLLEFFEDMFSGFLGICLQLYIILDIIGWTGKEGGQETRFVAGELIGSILSLLSMFEAIKRRDDGFVNSVYVRLGWIFMFGSRALAFCLATTILKSWILTVILIHCLGFNCWIFHIARESYYDVIVHDKNATIDWKIGYLRGRILLWLLCFVIYGIPSLIYWPLMFQMKDAGRVQTFCLLILIENVFLGTIWTLGVYLNDITVITSNTLILVDCILLMTTLIAIWWLQLYLKRKPYDTDKRVLLKILQEDSKGQPDCASDYGVSYIFYSQIFAFPTINHLMKSVEPYCHEDRLLFSINIDSTSETDEKEDSGNGNEIETPLEAIIPEGESRVPGQETNNRHQDETNERPYFRCYDNHLYEFSDADDESSDNVTSSCLLFARSYRRSKDSLVSLTD